MAKNNDSRMNDKQSAVSSSRKPFVSAKQIWPQASEYAREMIELDKKARKGEERKFGQSPPAY